MVLGLPSLTITLISSSAQITLNIGYWSPRLLNIETFYILPIVIGVKHLECLLNVIIKLILSALLPH